MTKVVLGTKEHPNGFIPFDEMAALLKEYGQSPFVFLNDLIDPLMYEHFGDLIRLLDSPFIVFTSLAGYLGWRALRANGIAGDKSFVRNCEHIHAFNIQPNEGGLLNPVHFLRRARQLALAGYQVTMYIYNLTIEMQTWFDLNKTVHVQPWKFWPTTTSGRYRHSCKGEQTVVGPNGYLYPCVVACAASFGRGVYRGSLLAEGVAIHEGRDECSLRGCPNGSDAENFGSYRFVRSVQVIGGQD